ncbi:MAG: F0F1-ATPase subunit [Flavobacteriales bacterium CG_4_9_14_3_um_filter_40_17]|nr:MAG: F0F1-ATPase subunit [Flavobacteriales bacterium CG_4_9_14_3_um_filter_40_17]
MNHQKLPKKKPSNRWLYLISFASQMGITIYVFIWIGKKLDLYFEYEHRTFVIVFTLLGVAFSMFNLNRQLKKLNS